MGRAEDIEFANSLAYTLLQVCTHYCPRCGNLARPLKVLTCNRCHFGHLVQRTDTLDAAYRLGGPEAVVELCRSVE